MSITVVKTFVVTAAVKLYDKLLVIKIIHSFRNAT